MKREKKLTKEVWSWALYDWANSAFATTVMAGFFPLFFGEYWNTGVSDSEITYRLGMGNSIASISLALTASFSLGAMADVYQNKKKYLTFFCLLGVMTTAGFFFISQGRWLEALLFFCIARFGFAGGNIFYDSLLLNATSKKHYDFCFWLLATLWAIWAAGCSLP